jgi:hypothetical protein
MVVLDLIWVAFVLACTHWVARVWVCTATTDLWAGVCLSTAPSLSCNVFNTAWNNGEVAGGRVVLSAGKAGQGSGCEKDRVEHLDVWLRI